MYNKSLNIDVNLIWGIVMLIIGVILLIGAYKTRSKHKKTTITVNHSSAPMSKQNSSPLTEPASPQSVSELRWNPVLEEWVAIAAHRQGRPQMPKNWCPFCPGSGRVPDNYDVCIYPNDFPTFAEPTVDASHTKHRTLPNRPRCRQMRCRAYTIQTTIPHYHN